MHSSQAGGGEVSSTLFCSIFDQMRFPIFLIQLPALPVVLGMTCSDFPRNDHFTPEGPRWTSLVCIGGLLASLRLYGELSMGKNQFNFLFQKSLAFR